MKLREAPFARWRVLAATVALLPLGGACLLTATTAHRSLVALTTPGPTDAQDVVTLAVAAALTALGAWWALAWCISCLCSAARALGRPSRWGEAWCARISPAVVRRAAAALLGASALGALTAPAFASPVSSLTQPLAATTITASATSASPTTTSPTSTSPTSTSPTSEDSLAWPAAGSSWTASAPPRSPRTTTTPAPPAAPSRAGSTEGGIVVHRGDTLWTIAARALPAGTNAADIAREWPRWWGANRDVIGDDPDRLLPGQVLHAPVGTSAAAGQ